MWLAVDVWMCTASILHLVIISLDRYIAVTHPITYPNLMTSKKAKLLITGAWVISFVVCFPPLVGWNDKMASEGMQIIESILSGDFANGTSGIVYYNITHSTMLSSNNGTVGNVPEDYRNDESEPTAHLYSSTMMSNYSLFSSQNETSFSVYNLQSHKEITSQINFVANELQSILDRCQPKCMLTQDPGYVIYSAVGSFYAPMLIMMFLNCKIYRTAMKTTKAIRQGWTKVKGVNGEGNTNQVEMGIHRGGLTKNPSDVSAKSASCRVGNKKLEHQKTSPNFLASSTANGNNNNALLCVNDTGNARRFSLNIPRRRPSNTSNNNSKQIPKDKHVADVSLKESKQLNQVPNLYRIQQSPTTETAQISRTNSDVNSVNPTKTRNININVIDKTNPTQKKSIIVEHTCTEKARLIHNTDRVNSKHESQKSEKSDNAVLLNSKSVACIESMRKNEDEDCKAFEKNEKRGILNVQQNYNYEGSINYCKTHSLSSIPTNEHSVNHLMDHTNKLFKSRTNSKNRNRSISDTKENIDEIGVMDILIEAPTLSLVDTSDQMCIIGGTTSIEKCVYDKNKILRDTSANLLPQTHAQDLKNDTKGVSHENTTQKSLSKFRHNTHCGHHSRKTFSEQSTQTDPKANTFTEEEGINLKNAYKPNSISVQTTSIDSNNSSFKLKFGSLKFKSVFSRKYNIVQTGEKTNFANNDFELKVSTKKNDFTTDSQIATDISRLTKDIEEERILDNNSIGSKRATDSSKSYSCFQCHPRRWSRQKGRFKSCCWKDSLSRKKSNINKPNTTSFKHTNYLGGSQTISSNFTPATRSAEDNGDGDVSPPNFHGSAEDDIHIYPLTGVAAMINQVVNQTVNITAAATGPSVVNNASGTKIGHFGKRNIKTQVRRFRMETKAAKTLGIIVGCFICCWFPFFTIYLIAAFCSNCIPEIVFDIFFWLGYCNSALNPFIYAMFSREFRGAFKKIVYKLFCMKYEETPKTHSVISGLMSRNMVSNTRLGSTSTGNVDVAKKVAHQ